MQDLGKLKRGLINCDAFQNLMQAELDSYNRTRKATACLMCWSSSHEDPAYCIMMKIGETLFISN